MNRNRLLIAIILLLLSAPHQLHAQEEDLDKKIQYRSDELEKIRKEIESYKQNLKQVERKEQTLLNNLQGTEHEISLTKKLVTQLTREQARKEQEIKNSKKSIFELEEDLSSLKERFARRLIHVHKRGDLSDWELILTSRSINQAFYRYKYLRIIADIDKRNAEDIRKTIRRIDVKKQQMEAGVRDMSNIISEKQVQQSKLTSQKKTREKQLEQARVSKSNLSAQIKEKEKAASEVSRMIANLEKQRVERDQKLARQRAKSGVTVTDPFRLAQGKLLWPTDGQVIAKFCRQKHPTLNTITQNTGIDIRAPKGRDVKTVMDGMVTTITYIRGFGNTLIIDHGSGFYTVYTHIEDVFVNEDDYVTAGSVIANVGDTGSLNGNMLHFEIWKNRTALNPEEWLTRR